MEPAIYAHENVFITIHKSSENADKKLNRLLEFTKEFLTEYNGNIPLNVAITETPEAFYGPDAKKRGITDFMAAIHREHNLVILNADGIDINNPTEIRESLRHEILGHYGLLTFKLEDKIDLYNEILKTRQSPEFKELWAHIDKAYPHYNDYPYEGKYHKADEMFAYVAQKPEHFFKDSWSKVRALFHKLLTKCGLKNKDNYLTMAELRVEALKVAEGIRNGTRQQQYSPPDDKILFSRSTTLSEITPRPFSDPLRTEAQAQLIQEVKTNPDLFLSAYCNDPRTFGGRYVNSDLMKEMFPVYSASPEARNYYNLPFHNAAAVLANAQFSHVVNEKNFPEQRIMRFVTGTPGAGKSTAITSEDTLPKHVRGVYEGQLAYPPSAMPKIREALKAGLQPQIVVVHTKPEIALHNSMFRYETVGRGASFNLIADILGKLPEGLEAIHKEFGNDVGLKIVDKREPHNPAILLGWNNLSLLQSEGTYEQIRTRLSEHLERIKDTISPGCYAQATGAAPEPPARAGDRARGDDLAQHGDGGQQADGHRSGIPEQESQGTILRHRMK